jgi:hypothetical protein
MFVNCPGIFAPLQTDLSEIVARLFLLALLEAHILKGVLSPRCEKRYPSGGEA